MLGSIWVVDQYTPREMVQKPSTSCISRQIRYNDRTDKSITVLVSAEMRTPPNNSPARPLNQRSQCGGMLCGETQTQTIRSSNTSEHWIQDSDTGRIFGSGPSQKPTAQLRIEMTRPALSHSELGSFHITVSSVNTCCSKASSLVLSVSKI